VQLMSLTAINCVIDLGEDAESIPNVEDREDREKVWLKPLFEAGNRKHTYGAHLNVHSLKQGDIGGVKTRALVHVVLGNHTG